MKTSFFEGCVWTEHCMSHTANNFMSQKNYASYQKVEFQK